jgi:hypothetical protein
LSAHDCQVPTPTSQNLELERRIRIFGADWLINCLEDWNPQSFICLQIYLQKKKGKFWEVGVGDWQFMQDSFFEFADEQVLGEG